MVTLLATPSPRPSSTSIGAFTCAAGMAIVGTSIAIAPSLSDYPVLAGQAWRYLLAGVLLAAVLGFQMRPLLRVSTGNLVRLVLIAATGLAAFNWLLIEGTRHADPAFMAAMVGATPLVLALAGPVAGGARVRGRTVVGGAVVVAGIVLVHGATSAPLIALPYAVSFLACEVAFTLLAVPVLKELTPVQLSAAACLIAAPMLAALSMATAEPSLQVPSVTEVLALLYMAIFTTAVAFILWYSGVVRLGADRAGLFCGVMPIAGYLAGLALGSSTWSVTALTGVLLCGLGIAVGLSRGRPPASPPAPSPAQTLESPHREGQEHRSDHKRPHHGHEQGVLLDPGVGPAPARAG
jgi:drug/metabolite transporter (DMT)-like permease